LSQPPCFVNYHRVLNRARWSLLAASHTLLRLLVTRFAPEGELVFGLDDSIERRRGEHIVAKGISLGQNIEPPYFPDVYGPILDLTLA